MAASKGFASWHKQALATINAKLKAVLPADRQRFSLAMRYATLGGGKRIRPLLCLAVAKDCGATKDATNLAVAVELIHCYSLIHDDLPCMDDDDLRRGKPSCHKKFDEATAVLAGDALQALAFATLAKAKATNEQIALLANACGHSGMVGGQSIDISKQAKNLIALKAMHQQKTGALFQAAIGLGGLSAQVSSTQQKTLAKLASNFGLAFQIADDLKATSPVAQTGKQPGSDQHSNTYVTVLGRTPAGKQLYDTIDDLKKSFARASKQGLQLDKTYAIAQQVFPHQLY